VKKVRPKGFLQLFQRIQNQHQIAFKKFDHITLNANGDETAKKK
jgi:hypothetical protein